MLDGVLASDVDDECDRRFQRPRETWVIDLKRSSAQLVNCSLTVKLKSVQRTRQMEVRVLPEPPEVCPGSTKPADLCGDSLSEWSSSDIHRDPPGLQLGRAVLRAMRSRLDRARFAPRYSSGADRAVRETRRLETSSRCRETRSSGPARPRAPGGIDDRVAAARQRTRHRWSRRVPRPTRWPSQ